jgi:hypothetical protein
VAIHGNGGVSFSADRAPSAFPESAQPGGELFVSVLVMKEVERGDILAAKERLARLQECQVLPYETRNS